MRVYIALLLSLAVVACDDDTSTTDASADGSASVDAATDVGPSSTVPAACQAFCRARQINIQNCAAQDGDRRLTETYEQCAGGHKGDQFVDLCPTDPSCGGWLAGCISDPDSAKSDRFPSGTTCADSVAANRFRP